MKTVRLVASDIEILGVYVLLAEVEYLVDITLDCERIYNESRVPWLAEDTGVVQHVTYISVKVRVPVTNEWLELTPSDRLTNQILNALKREVERMFDRYAEEYKDS